MLNFLRNKNIIKSNKVAGIQAFVKSGEEILFYYVLISRNKGKIEIEKSGTVQAGFDQLSEEVSSGIPVFLSVDGKGVLSKKVTADPLKSPIHQVIPNASEEDFLIQQVDGTNNQALVSIARKDFIDGIIQDFATRKFRVLGLTLGPFKAVKLLHIFEQLPGELVVGNYQVSYDRVQAAIIDYKKSEEPAASELYTIDDRLLPSEYLLPFYHALSYYIPDENELQYPPIAEQFEEHASKRVFTFAGWASLLLLFAVLLGNMFMFTSYSDKKRKLESLTAGNKELLATLKIVKDELAWKEKFLNQAGILKNTRMSYYADQVALTLPHDITLEKMEIYPVVSQIKKQKEIELLPDKISINGLADNSQLVNDWMNDLKRLNWVEDVKVVDYSMEENAVTGSFSIEIKIIREKEI